MPAAYGQPKNLEYAAVRSSMLASGANANAAKRSLAFNAGKYDEAVRSIAALGRDPVKQDGKVIARAAEDDAARAPPLAGLLSPPHAVTLPTAQRGAIGIPPPAQFFSFAYPVLGGLGKALERLHLATEVDATVSL